MAFGKRLPEGVTLDEPDLDNLPPVQVAEGMVRLVLRIENAYARYDEVITYADVVVPAPPAEDATYPGGKDPNGDYETPYEAWTHDHVISLTGVGHYDGDSWYDVTVLWSSDPDLTDRTFEWGY